MRLHAADKKLNKYADCESLNLFLLVSCFRKEQKKREVLISSTKASFCNEVTHRAMFSKGQSTLGAVAFL